LVSEDAILAAASDETASRQISGRGDSAAVADFERGPRPKAPMPAWMRRFVGAPW
jgi:hypothetical protein